MAQTQSPEKKKRKKRSRYPDARMLRRTLALLVFFGIALFGLLLWKLGVLMLGDNTYVQQAVSNQTTQALVKARRGAILDADGNTLAISIPTYTVYISPYERLHPTHGSNPDEKPEDAEFIAESLETLLKADYGVTEADIMALWENEESWYQIVARDVDAGTADKIREFKDFYTLVSVYLEETSRRSYPNGSLACHVLGFLSETDEGTYEGTYGVENSYNSYLAGSDGTVVRTLTGDKAAVLKEYSNDVQNGCDVNTTIKTDIQSMVEERMSVAIDEYGAKGGCCIVMDIHSGAILSMASFGGYDPNDHLALSEEDQAEVDAQPTDQARLALLEELQYAQWGNMAVNSTYEPGSVFKIITLAMAMEEGLADEDSTYLCEGAMTVLGREADDPVHCSNLSGHGLITLPEAVKFSCNIAFVEMGMQVGASTFYRYCRAFGLFDKTGIDLPGETNSIWWSDEVFTQRDNLSQLAAASFGQTFTVTPLQMITAVAAATNGGYLMQPYVVSSVTDADGEQVYAHDATPLRQVISEDVSARIRAMLELGVSEDDGTGHRAYVKGYHIAGKTGTAEIISTITEDGYKEYVASFCGIAPANDPEIAVLVLFDQPSHESSVSIGGGTMAAPVAGRIIANALNILGYTPEN